MKIAQIRDMKNEELKKFIEEKKAEALSLRFDLAARQTKNVKALAKLRKGIARALTILSERAAKGE